MTKEDWHPAHFERISIFGAGIMGSDIAFDLVAAGIRAVAWLDPERGPVLRG